MQHKTGVLTSIRIHPFLSPHLAYADDALADVQAWSKLVQSRGFHAGHISQPDDLCCTRVRSSGSLYGRGPLAPRQASSDALMRHLYGCGVSLGLQMMSPCMRRPRSPFDSQACKDPMMPWGWGYHARQQRSADGNPIAELAGLVCTRHMLGLLRRQATRRTTFTEQENFTRVLNFCSLTCCVVVFFLKHCLPRLGWPVRSSV